jgi:hypothetical protein
MSESEKFPQAQGRAFDPDWSPLVAVGVLVWLIAGSVAAYFLWTWVV